MIPDRDTGIQIEKPVLPWEYPGCFRLDCEPHRGRLLWRMAAVSLIVTFLSTFLFICVGLIVAIPLSLATRSLARRDLAKMEKGLIDLGGKELTEDALDISFIALLVAILAPVCWAALCLFFIGWSQSL